MIVQYEYPSLTEKGRELERKEGWQVGKWWKRRLVSEYFPAIERNNPSVQQFLTMYGMKKNQYYHM